VARPLTILCQLTDSSAFPHSLFFVDARSLFPSYPVVFAIFFRSLSGSPLSSLDFPLTCFSFRSAREEVLSRSPEGRGIRFFYSRALEAFLYEGVLLEAILVPVRLKGLIIASVFGSGALAVRARLIGVHFRLLTRSLFLRQIFVFFSDYHFYCPTSLSRAYPSAWGAVVAPVPSYS